MNKNMIVKELVKIAKELENDKEDYSRKDILKILKENTPKNTAITNGIAFSIAKKVMKNNIGLEKTIEKEFNVKNGMKWFADHL